MRPQLYNAALEALESRQLLSAGDLDVSFSADGKQVIDLPGVSNEFADATVVQPDGKVILVGRAVVGAELDFTIARLLETGAIDTTFGGGDGFVTVDFQVNDEAKDVALDSAGRIVVVGTTSSGAGSNARQFAVARLTAAGALDSTFSGDGKTTVDFGINADAQSVAIDGSLIYIGGYKDLGSTGQFALARLLSNGSPDTTYSTDGEVFFGFGGNNDSRCFDIAVDSAGRVVMVGYDENFSAPSGGRNIAYARVGTNALVDSNFSGDGLAVTDFTGADDEARSVVIDRLGRIVVGGFTEGTGGNDFVVTRLTDAGSGDSSFNGDGRFVLNLGGVEAVDEVVLHPDNDITAVGQTSVGAFQAALVRISGGSGDISTTFGDGGDGIQLVDFGGIDDGFAAALDPRDLRLVFAGTDGGGRLAVGRVHDLIDQNYVNALGRVSHMHALPDGRVLALSQGVVRRLLPDGANDGSFNAISNFVRAFDIDSHGRILTASAVNGGTQTAEILVRRFSSEGVLDTSFAGDGSFQFSFHTAAIVGGSSVHDIEVDSADRIVLAGIRTLGNSVAFGDVAVARVTAFGTLDASFDGDGINVLTSDDSDTVRDVAIAPNGQIVVVGADLDLFVGEDAQVHRFNSNGNLDLSFGTLGAQRFHFEVQSYNRVHGLAFDASSRIVLGGESSADFEAPFRAFVARLTTGGALDDTFDGDGKKLLSAAENDFIEDVLVEADGTILTIGNAFDSLGTQTVIRRLIPGAAVVGDSSFAGDGLWVSGQQPVSSIQQDAAAVLVNGALLVGGGLNRIERLNVDPAVVDFEFRFETAPQNIRAKFNDDVGASIIDFDVVIRNNTTATILSTAAYDAQPFETGINRLAVNFNSILADGNYSVTFSSTGITNRQNMQLTGNRVREFFFLNGDANRDRKVDIGDFAILAGRFNQSGTFSQGNFDYAGIVDIADFSILATQFNKTLPAPADAPRTPSVIPVPQGANPTFLTKNRGFDERIAVQIAL